VLVQGENSPDADLREVAERMRAWMDSEGWGSYCDASKWRKHPSVRAAIRKGERLLTFLPDGTTTVHYALAVAILEPIPTPKAKEAAQLYRQRLALIKSLGA
jgi:hypothetical protein